MAVTANERSFIKDKAKDSVFCDLFSIPKYQLELYKFLHPEDEDITLDDLETVTIENILTNQMYNDLGFMARNKLMVFVEAMVRWSINIIPRIDMYRGESLNNYIIKTEQRKFSTRKMKLPKPEFYVLYTGDQKNIGEWCSMADEFYDGDKTFGDTRVRVLRGVENGKDIVSQYVTFTKILNKQEKLYGHTRESITETINKCIEENVLKEYLEERRFEVTDIMTSLYDQEQATREYAQEYAEGQREEGKKEGKREGLKEAAERMLSKAQLSDRDVAEYSGLTLEEVQSIRKTLLAAE